MDDGTVQAEAEKRNEEDYTGACCWLFWRSKAGEYDTRQALVDIEDFERVCHHSWRINMIGKCRKPRVTRSGNIYLAREIMGFPVGMTVDHRNRNSLDDRRHNLRVCTVRENNLNSAGCPGASSRFKGVAWSTKDQKWKVITGTKQQKVYIGRFDDEVEAARAYNEYAKKHFGHFAYLNPV